MKKFLKRILCCILCLIIINVQGLTKVEAASKIVCFKNSSVQNFHLTDLSGSHISLEWNKLKGATGYTLLRSTDKDGKYSEVVGTTETVWTDATADYGVTYYYKIFGETLYNGKVYNSKSVIKQITATPDKPVVSISTVNNEVKLTIQKVKGADGYILYMAASKNGSYQAIKTFKSGESLTYVKSGLNKGTYYFKVRAFCTQNKKNFYGNYSNVKTAQVEDKQVEENVTGETSVNAFEYEIKSNKATIIKFTDKTLQKVIIPKEIEGYPVTTIASDAFCTYIVPTAKTADEMLYGEKEETKKKEGFRVKEIIVPDSVTTLENRAFSRCDTLEKITLPNSLKTLGALDDDSDYAGIFRNCSALKEINIPDSLKVIGVSTFEGCDSLENVVLPNSVEYIGEKAFDSCIKLESITLSNNMKLIGKQAFYECNSLKSVAVPGSTKKICEQAFARCSNLKEIILNEGIEEIETMAFEDCDKLIEVTIPGSVTNFDSSILDYDSYQGSALEKVILTEGVRRISVLALGDSLKYIYIPKSVTVIDESHDDFYYKMSDCYAVITPKGSYAEKWFTEEKIPVIAD